MNGNFAVEYLYRGKGRLAMVDVSTGAIYYYLNDRLGTPQIMTDSTNTVIWEGVYKPFGEADVNPNSSVVNNFRFPGQYFDEETGLHYNWHRYYDPSTGRYLTPDPIGIIGGLNPYVYSRNNSINIIDSTGLMDPVTISLFIVGAPILVGATYYALAPPERQRAIENFIKNQILTSPLVMAAVAWLAGDDSDKNEECEVGDLTDDEVEQIQKVVDEAGRPLDVVGSAAKGERSENSDIDYIVGPSSIDHYRGQEGDLPSIDPEHGIIPGTHNPYQGPSIRFEPRVRPKYIPGAQ